MSGASTTAEAVAVGAGRVLAVGRRQEVLAQVGGPRTRLEDLGGRTVLPGFIDAHVHLEVTSLAIDQAVDCRSPGVLSIGELIERLREKAAQTPVGEWVLGQGTFFQDTLIREGRYPDRYDLDQVSRDHPLLVRFSFHVVVLNSYALNLCGVNRDTADPPGGQVQRDADGEPTGMTRDMVHHLNLPPPRATDVRTALLRVGREQVLGNGVTSIQEISGTRRGVATLASLVQSADLPLRVALSTHVPGTLPLVDALNRRHTHFTFDDTWFTDGGIKLFADGGTTANAAAFYEPYHNEPTTRGRLAFTSDEFGELMDACHQHEHRVCVHAVGDRAQDTVLDGFEAFARRNRVDGHRHRVEHAGNLTTTDARLARYKQLGLIPTRIPPLSTRSAALPRRTLVQIAPVSHSDSGRCSTWASSCLGTPIARVQNRWAYRRSFANIWCAVTRRTSRGGVLAPEEAISVQEGLEMFTRHAAYGLGQENEKGTLEVGKLADLVVLAEDPLAVPVDHVKDIQVDRTYVGGQLAYTRSTAQAGHGGAPQW